MIEHRLRLMTPREKERNGEGVLSVFHFLVDVRHRATIFFDRVPLCNVAKIDVSGVVRCISEGTALPLQGC